AELRADRSIIPRAKTDSTVYSEPVRQVANSFNNQFQLPVLFYLACIFAILFGEMGLWAGVFAWGFVGARIAHAAIHCSYNFIPHRFLAFLASLICLIGLWVVVVMAAHGHPLLTGANPLTGLSGS
ncbi:MAG: MAPEG family protein, partial [Pseudomonadota bacterium]